ncbi:hypothetical protein [Desulfobaculum bizertense]|uniref:hypothetical protein n=1 Tax=Desulfobaculum bizertense TaxID=376490 RepID=UPI0009998883|nr:hypothetical protein [Desulfobaculum bizertense]
MEQFTQEKQRTRHIPLQLGLSLGTAHTGPSCLCLCDIAGNTVLQKALEIRQLPRSEPELTEWEDALVRELRRLCAPYLHQIQSCRIGISPGDVVYRELSFPFRDDEKVSQAIRLGLEDEFPVPVSQLSLVYWPVWEQCGQHMFSVCGVDRSRLESMERACERAGFPHASCQPSLCAMCGRGEDIWIVTTECGLLACWGEKGVAKHVLRGYAPLAMIQDVRSRAQARGDVLPVRVWICIPEMLEEDREELTEQLEDMGVELHCAGPELSVTSQLAQAQFTIASSLAKSVSQTCVFSDAMAHKPKSSPFSRALTAAACSVCFCLLALCFWLGALRYEQQQNYRELQRSVRQELQQVLPDLPSDFHVAQYRSVLESRLQAEQLSPGRLPVVPVLEFLSEFGCAHPSARVQRLVLGAKELRAEVIVPQREVPECTLHLQRMSHKARGLNELRVEPRGGASDLSEAVLNLRIFFKDKKL